MARYTYNAGLVTQAIEKLCSACDALNNTNVDIQKGISTINSARGSGNIDVDFSVITGYQSQVIEYIDTMNQEIRNKAQEIEEYQSAPWYKKVLSTIGMGALKLVEGLATFIENIGDGLVSVVGFVGGIFSSDFKDSVSEFVKTDWVGDTAAKWYEEGWLQDVNKYSAMSHESTAANILKGVGVAAGYVIVGVATAGAGTAVSLGVSAAAAGVGGIGSGTQSGLQAGMTFNQAFGQGVKQGAVAAGTTLLVGGVANKLGSLGKAAGSIDDAGAVLAGSADDVGKALATTGDDIINAGDDVLRVASGTADDILTTGTSLADEVAANLDDGAKIVGKAIAENGDELVVVQNAAGKTAAIAKHGDEIGAIMTNNVDEIAAAVAKNGGVYDDIGGLLTNVDDVTNAGTQAAAAVDDIANAGTNALAVIDDVANTGTNALAVVDDVANTGTNALAVVDDVANTGTNALAVVDDVANVADDAARLVDDVANVADDAAGLVDDVANVADDAAKSAKPGLGQRIANKVDEAITNFGTNTKVGQALSNAAATAGPKVTNAVAAVAGPAVAGTLSDPIETSMYRDAVQVAENPTIGQSLYQETTLTPDQIPSENTNPIIDDITETITEGTGPEDTGPKTNYPGGGPTGGTPTGGTPTGGTPTGGTPNVPSVELPDYPSTPDNGTGNQPTITVPETEMPDYPDNTITPDDIVGGNDNILPGPGTNPSNPQNPSISGTKPNIPGISGGNSGINESTITSSEVLDKFGDMSGSLSGIIENSKTNIPTSSAPILTSDGTTSKSMIPLGAGLGAAALAGIGTKAYLDKKSKSEEDEEINTEEWEEDADSVEIDYGLETNEESDYLSPTDEYAFQE